MTEIAAQRQAEPAAQASHQAAKPPKAALNAARAFWLKQLHSWHWISAAVSLSGLILFAVTGITLNHAAAIPAEPVTVEQTATLPAPLLERLAGFADETTDPVPDAVARWSVEAMQVQIAGKPTETTAEEIYVALPTPGGDGWLTIDRSTGEAVHEKTTRGWIAYLNDLHKGRNAGSVWFWFIDVFAVACTIFALTGLALMWLHAKGRPSTWPLAALGLLIPVVIALIFIH
ncbi:PepSY-associated TM helix domain-containing protein [uncultured Brevundimonas sp.]|uniref:PepSY-associated TM helix domain-containing protein n=1 Tax=uncultured Brevundimonas sp. TaxID=213418 RepID=UPI00345DB9C5